MKSKKIRNSVIALSLVAIVGVGGTLAYLTATTEEKTNTFTMGKGITGETQEPNWKEEDAQNFTPGKVIAKDPMIKNLSDEGTDPVYAAATITYQIKGTDGSWLDTTYLELDKFINIKSGNPLVQGFNSIDWTMDKDNTVAYYTKEKVDPQKTTTTIFDAVEIDKLALTPEQIASADSNNIQFDKSSYKEVDDKGNVISYTSYEMRDFQIVVKGYLVQGSDKFSDCRQAMQTAFPDIFK